MADETPPERERILSGDAPSNSGPGLPADAIKPAAPPVTPWFDSGQPSQAEQPHGWLARILGWITFAGLILLLLSYGVGPQGLPYPIPITLVGCGACCFFLAGIPWAHTRGQRGLKAAFLGAVGFAGGGMAGAFAGLRIGGALDHQPGSFGGEIFGLIAGFWVCAIPFASVGIRWAIRFHGRYGPGWAAWRVSIRFKRDGCQLTTKPPNNAAAAAPPVLHPGLCPPLCAGSRA